MTIEMTIDWGNMALNFWFLVIYVLSIAIFGLKDPPEWVSGLRLGILFGLFGHLLKMAIFGP